MSTHAVQNIVSHDGFYFFKNGRPRSGMVVGKSYSQPERLHLKNIKTGLDRTMDATIENTTLFLFLNHTIITKNPIISCRINGCVGTECYETGGNFLRYAFFISLNGGVLSHICDQCQKILSANYVMQTPLSMESDTHLTANEGDILRLELRGGLDVNFTNNTGIDDSPVIVLGGSGYSNYKGGFSLSLTESVG